MNPATKSLIHQTVSFIRGKINAKAVVWATCFLVTENDIVNWWRHFSSTRQLLKY